MTSHWTLSVHSSYLYRYDVTLDPARPLQVPVVRRQPGRGLQPAARRVHACGGGGGAAAALDPGQCTAPPAHGDSATGRLSAAVSKSLFTLADKYVNGSLEMHF